MIKCQGEGNRSAPIENMQIRIKYFIQSPPSHQKKYLLPCLRGNTLASEN